MDNLKFDKEDLRVILDALDDLQYEDCKRAVDDPYWEGPKGTVEDVHGLISKYSRKKEHYIELYMTANPDQKEYFHCPKCKRILNVYEDFKLKDGWKKAISWQDLGKREEVFWCKDCGWTGEEAPFEEEKVSGNPAE